MAEYDYQFFGWRVSVKSALVDLEDPEHNQFEVEVFAIDGDRPDLVLSPKVTQNIRGFMPAWPMEEGLDYLDEFIRLLPESRNPGQPSSCSALA